MVSNEEIKQRLGHKREGKGINGYLVCDTCEGSYELQPGESPEDFSSECECGGQLKLSTTDKSFQSEDEKVKYSNDIIISYLLIFLLFPLAIILGLYLITRDNTRARYHGKIVLTISLIILSLIILRVLL